MECKESGFAILCEISCHYIYHLSKGKGTILQQKIITLLKVEKGQKVDWAQIIFNNLCSELDRWYKYVKENKGDKKDTYQSTLVLAKIFQYLFVHQKNNTQKPPAKVKRTKEKMQTTLENKKKVVTDSPKRRKTKLKKEEPKAQE